MLATIALSLALLDIWVDPVNGQDTSDGTTRTTAVRTLGEAWRRVPRETPLTTGVRIQLMAGEHPRSSIPTYFESRWGTADAPIVIQSADGSRTAHLRGDLNLYDVRYLSLVGLDIRPDPPGDVVHCELCNHFTIRDSHLDGGAREAYETLKINQSQYVYIESSDIHGAYDNAIDMVAVQYGHVIDNRIWDAQDWCMYAKGGSAYMRIERNEIFQCGTGGFTAGQGTGFQYMTSPWLHYEAYGITATNNFIHDTEGAGLGVNGGYNILFAYNTLERVGSRSHMIEVVYGGRSCDGEAGDPSRVRCQQNLDAGGWGNTLIADGNNYTRIPNRNVYIYNNLLRNPSGFVSPAIFSIAEPYEGLRADENLQIRGNTIVNAGDLGAPESILSDNTINGAGTNQMYAIPPFTWTDAPMQPRVPPPPTGKRRSARH
ncbi:MAG TPA: right-handed parallel beta-helix repeat-containing protein [Thermoanaerobaculia bacterium]|jgi:hypothetical protein